MINTSNRNKWFMLLLGSLLLFSLLFLSGCGMSWSEQREAKAQVEQYLKEKYGKEFTIEKSYSYRNQLGDKPDTISNGYPKDNPKIKVKVSTGFDGDRIDNYLLQYGKNEANMRMQSVLDNVYGKDNAIPDISCGLDDQKVYDQKWGRTPSLDELMGKYSDQMHYKLYMAVFRDLKPEQFNDEFKNVYKIIGYMKSLKLKRNSLSLNYYLPKDKAIVSSVIREKGIGYVDGPQRTYRIYIDEEYFDQINSPEDIKKYFQGKE